MSLERESLISNLPFIRKFIFEVIKQVKTGGVFSEERIVIHADLVPRVSEKVMQASLRQKIIPSKEPLMVIEPTPMKRSLIIPPRHFPQQQKPQLAISEIKTPPLYPIPAPAPPTSLEQINVSDYGKLNPLLNDLIISSIECSGPGQPLVIYRKGQRQLTRVELTPQEIKEFLEEVAANGHIPLLEGVFRAAVDNFAISAVISEIIGSKFVIKKHTPYSLLEKPF